MPDSYHTNFISIPRVEGDNTLLACEILTSWELRKILRLDTFGRKKWFFEKNDFSKNSSSLVLQVYKLKLILRIQNKYVLTAKLIKRLQLPEKLRKYRNKNLRIFPKNDKNYLRLKNSSVVVLHFYKLKF